MKCSWLYRRSRVVSSASACGLPPSDRSLPKIRSHWLRGCVSAVPIPGISASCMVIGANTSAGSPTSVPWKPGGPTPTTVNGCPFKRMRVADRRCLTAESTQPEAVAEDRDRSAPSTRTRYLIVFVRDRCPDRRPDAKNAKVRAGNQRSRDPFGFTILAEAHGCSAKGKYSLKCLAVIAEFDEQRVGRRDGLVSSDDHQPLRDRTRAGCVKSARAGC